MTTTKKLILDVGAGMYKNYPTILSHNKNTKIIAFEPHPDLYKKLIASDIYNIFNDTDRLQIHNIAIIDDKTHGNAKLYMINDPVASSLLKLNPEGVRQWKYPFLRPSFKTIDYVDIPSISIAKFMESIKRHHNCIELLNVDVQGYELNVLQGITPELFKRIYRIIVKCIDPEIKLYNKQSDIVDIFDTLEIHGFGLVHGTQYSRNQEHILEFINIDIHKHRNSTTHHTTNPIAYIDKTGVLQYNTI